MPSKQAPGAQPRHARAGGALLALFSFWAALLPLPAFSQAEEKFEIRNLGQCGLTTRYASSQIADTCLVEADNVYLDEDLGIVRRRGFTQFNTTALTASQSVRGIWPFRATDATDYIVVLSSNSMFQSSGDGTFAAISPAIASLSATQNMDCAQCLGRLWCVNGSDTMFFWTGTATGTVSGAPTCQAIDCFRNRVVLANCSGTLSQLRMSGELDGTDYTIPASPASTSPASLSIGGVNDGNEVRCIQGVYQDVLVTGKEGSTWGLYGFDRRDFAVREISREVGCIDNRSAREKQGSLYWLSKRGLEKMTGPSITRVSDPIRDLMDTIIVAGGNSRSAQDTTQGDFEAGNLTASGAGAPMSATISPANVVPSSSVLLDNTTSLFSDGTCSGCGVNSSGYVHFAGVTSTYVFRYDANDLPADVGWTKTGTQTESVASSSLTFTTTANEQNVYERSFTGASNLMFVFRAAMSGSGYTVFFIRTTGNIIKGEIVLATGTVSYRVGTSLVGQEDLVQPSYSTYTVVITTASDAYFYRNGIFRSSAVAVIGATTNGSIANFGCNATLGVCTSHPTYVDFFHVSSGVPSPGISDIVSVATFTSRIFDTTVSTPVFAPMTITSYPVVGTTLSYSIRTSTAGDDTGWEDYVSFSNPSVPTSARKRYVQYRSTFTQLNLVESPGITRVNLPASTTGYFISQCRNPGTAITSWGLFQCNRVLNNGDMTFYVSTGTTCNGATRTTNTWTTQTNNSVITIATAAFVAYRVLFDIDSGTETPTLNDCTINWNEGATRPAIASEVYRDRYYLAYTSATAGTVVNDRLLVLDSRDQWVLHDAPNCSALSIYNRNLYCGDSGSNGRVYRVDNGQDDDGASFTSRIRTKDFDFGNTWQRKMLSRMYFDLSGLPSQDVSISLTPSYTLDASTDVFTLTAINLNEDYSRFIAAKVPALLSNNVTGRWFNFSLSNTGLVGPWKVFGIKIVFSRLTED